VRDDGGGSPWGVVVAVAVVAMLGLLAVLVRRRRSTP
jgi:MYXO-CTERM domain-containing protein